MAANYVVKANGNQVYSTTTPSTSLSYGYTATQDANMEVTATNPADGSVVTKTFTVSMALPVTSAPIPSYMRQGINYDPADPTKVGLALFAPGKPYVHAIGSFNN